MYMLMMYICTSYYVVPLEEVVYLNWRGAQRFLHVQLPMN